MIQFVSVGYLRSLVTENPDQRQWAVQAETVWEGAGGAAGFRQDGQRCWSFLIPPYTSSFPHSFLPFSLFCPLLSVFLHLIFSFFLSFLPAKKKTTYEIESEASNCPISSISHTSA